MEKYDKLLNFEEKKKLVIQRLEDFDLPYTEEDVKKLIHQFWCIGCCNEANVTEIVLQHQYNIS